VPEKSIYQELAYIFRAYDIRGIYNQEITPENFYRIGLAFGTFIQTEQGFQVNKHHVYISYDIRRTSPLLVQAFIAGVLVTGIHVEFSGDPLQFGACLFSAWKREAFAIAYVTASHLPPEWNGIKFYHGNGVGFSEKENMRIRDIFIEGVLLKAPWNQTGQLEVVNLSEEYKSFLLSKFKLKRVLKVVIDCGNGSSCLSAPEILSGFGMEVIPIFCTVDPTFPNRASEPNEESLKMLAEKVKAVKADFGVGFDGDGDRAVIVDDKGRIILSDITGLILARYMLEEDKSRNRVIINVECSLTIEKVLSSSAIVDRIKVGHTFLTEAAQKFPDTIIGIESSGHMVFPTVYLFDDAMLIPIKLAEILSQEECSLSQIIDQLPKLSKRKVAISTPDRIKFNVINRLLANIRNKYDNVSDIDGIGISFGEESWVLIRASNTSPNIRIIVESDSDSRAEELLTQFQKLLEETINEFT